MTVFPDLLTLILLCIPLLSTPQDAPRKYEPPPQHAGLPGGLGLVDVGHVTLILILIGPGLRVPREGPAGVRLVLGLRCHRHD